MAVNVTKCPKCNRLVPPKGGVCLYCGTSLVGAATSVAPEEPRTLGAKARFKPQGDDRLHYLLGDARDPVTLEGGKLFVLGRDPRTSLHVHAPDVSRQHAEIDWQGDPARPVLCEVRSKNGTFLNDKLVTRDAPQPLRNGDRIRLGQNFELLYLHIAERDMKRELQDRSQEETRELRVGPGQGRSEPTPPPEEPAEELREVGATQSGRQPRAPATAKRPSPPESTRGMTMAHGRKAQAVPTGDELDALVNAALGEAASPGGAGAVEGDLSQTSGSDLLRQLIEKRATGVLTVFDGAQTGEVVLKEGQSAQVTFGKVTGRPALTAVVRLRRGSYRFRPGAGGSEDPTALDAGLDVPADGNLSTTSARDLIKALLARKKTGALTIFDGQDTGEVTLVEGVVEHAALGGHVGREALNAIVALEQGAYRFRSDGDTGRIASDDLTAGDAAWSMPMPQPIGTLPPPPPARSTSSTQVARRDAWDVDPDDTLMPAEFSGATQAPPASPTRDRPTVPLTPPTPFKDARPSDTRVNPLRSPKNATNPPPTRPSRSNMPALPQNPPPAGPPAAGPAPATDPRRTGPQPRRAPPPLPPREGPSGPGSDRHRRP